MTSSLQQIDGGTRVTLVTDLTMGASSGLELARSLRAGKPGLKVLFISGARPTDMSAEEFLPKPFRPKDLLRRLREILDGSRERASSG